MKKSILALLLALTFSGHATAQNPWYVEIAVGEANLDPPPGREIARVPTLHLIGGSSCIPLERCFNNVNLRWPERDGEQAGRFSIGRHLGKFFFVEAGYLDFRDFEAESEAQGLEYHTSQAVSGFNLSGGVRYPITNALHVFAKAGLYAYQSKTTDKVENKVWQFYPHVSPPRPLSAEDLGLRSVDFYAEDRLLRISEKVSGNSVTLSLGASYSIMQSLDLKLEYQHLPDVEKTDIDLYLIGLAWRF